MKNTTIFIALLLFVFIQQTSGQSAFINEINYTASNPTQRGVELAGESGTNLEGWSVAAYAINGTVTYVEYLQYGLVPNQDNGYGAIWVDVDQNSNGGALALVNPNGGVVQFLSYGTVRFAQVIVTAAEGPAAGMTSNYVGTQLLPFNSLQLTGMGLGYGDFLWNLPTGTTPGTINTNQFFGSNQSLAGNNNGANATFSISQVIDYETNRTTIEILAYPNPTTDFVQVNLSQPLANAGYLRVFGANGQMMETAILPAQATSATADLSNFPAGRYVLQVNDGQEMKTLSIIKN